MKGLGFLLQFFSKKGVLIIGIVAGILLALLSGVAVHAEDLKEPDKEESFSGGYHYKWNDYDEYTINEFTGSFTRICLFHSDYSFGMLADDAVKIKGIKNGQSYEASFSPYQGMVCSCVNFGVTEFSSSGFLVFSNLDKAKEYISGTISDEDLTLYSNYDEWIKGQRDKDMNKYTLDYNSEIPYYDTCSLAVNQNQSATYTAKMSSTQQSKTKLNTSEDKENGTTSDQDYYQTGYKAYAIYIDTGTFGSFNDMVLELGLEKMIQTKKLDEVIKFDSSGRLIVKKLLSFGSDVGSSSSVSLSDVVGAKLLTPAESKESDCPIVAVDIDHFFSDLVPSFQRTLSADRYLNVNTKETTNSSIASHTHVLIGYYVTNIVYRKSDDNNECGNLSYSYQWIYDAFRQRYGSGTNVMSNTGFGNGDPILEPDLAYSYDSDGNIFSGSDFSQSGSLTPANLLDFIKSGFGLLSNNGTVGFIALAASFFYSVPVPVWMLVYFAMAVNIVVIVFKVLRGM